VPLFLGVWLLGGLYALLGALSLSELGAMIPRSGGQYVFVRRALGGYPGFVVGWSDWLSTCGTIAALGIVIGEYIGPLVAGLAGREGITGIVIVVAFAALQWRGVKQGDVVQQATSLLKGLALVGLALLAFVLAGDASSAGAVAGVAGATGTGLDAAGVAAGGMSTPTDAATVPSGFAFLAALVVAMQAAIFTYDGWTGPIYFGEEVRDAGRNVPRAMIGGVLLVIGIYLLLNIAFLRVVPIEAMAGDPFVAATVADRLFGPAGDTVIRVLMIVSLFAAVNANTLLASRVPFAMSRAGLLPASVMRVNDGGTPVVSLVLGTVIAVAFIATNTFDSVLALLAFFFVANYALSFTSVFVLRRREPDTPRPFRVPGYPVTAGVALLGSVAFLIAAVASDRANSLIALALLGASLPVYLLNRGRAAT
jgi:APA family basic amino acid/polyamine antiporter